MTRDGNNSVKYSIELKKNGIQFLSGSHHHGHVIQGESK